MRCIACGSSVSAASRFCSACGAQVVRPPQLTKRPVAALELGAIAGFALAGLGTFLPWATVGAFSFTAWEPELFELLLFAQAFSATFALDAILVLLYSFLGAYVVLANAGIVPAIPMPQSLGGKVVLLLLVGGFILPLFRSQGGWWQGFCVAALATLELLMVSSLVYSVGASEVQAEPGLGLYAAILGGAAAAFCGFLYSQQVGTSSREQIREASELASQDEEQLWH